MNADSSVNFFYSLLSLVAGSLLFVFARHLLAFVLYRSMTQMWRNALRTKQTSSFVAFENVFSSAAAVPWCVGLSVLYLRGGLSELTLGLGFVLALLLRLLGTVPWRADDQLLKRWFQQNAISSQERVDRAYLKLKMKVLRGLAKRKVANIFVLDRAFECTLILFILIRLTLRERVPFAVDFVSFGFAWAGFASAAFQRRGPLLALVFTAAAFFGVLALWDNKVILSGLSLFYGSGLVFALGWVVTLVRRPGVERRSANPRALSPARIRTTLEHIELGIPVGWRNPFASGGAMRLRRLLTPQGLRRAAQRADLWAFLLIGLLFFA